MALGGAVLAGGASSRMGSDKSLATVSGRTLAEVGIGALRAGGVAEPFVVGGDQNALAALGLTVIGDQFPGEGPLGGVITALDHVATQGLEVAVVLACDHDATTGLAVATMAGALGTADVAVAVIEGRMQLMHAAWRVSARAHLRAHFERGARSLRAGIAGLSIVQVLDGDPCWFNDVDTPAQLHSARDRRG